MKKLMTMIAAVGMAFGLFADPVIGSGTSFEGTEGGALADVYGDLTELNTDATEKAGYWDLGTLDGKEAAVKQYADDKYAEDRPWQYGTEGANFYYLSLATGTKTLTRYANLKDGDTVVPYNVADNGNYFADAIVKLTAFDSAPDTTDAKLALWLKDGPEWNDDAGKTTETNLMVSVNGVDYNCGDRPDLLDAWHRVTVKAMKINDAQMGFVIYIDKTIVTCTDTIDYTGITSFTPAAQAYKMANQLFPYTGTYATIESIGFRGKGDVDDIAFSTQIPDYDADDQTKEFAGDPAAFTLAWDKTYMKNVMTNGAPVEGTSPLTVIGEAPATLTFSWTGAEGKASGSKTVEPTAGRFEITVADLENAGAEFNEDPQTLATALANANAAPADCTLKLLTGTGTLAFNNANEDVVITLDLNGQTVTQGVDETDEGAIMLTAGALKIVDSSDGKVGIVAGNPLNELVGAVAVSAFDGALEIVDGTYAGIVGVSDLTISSDVPKFEYASNVDEETGACMISVTNWGEGLEGKELIPDAEEDPAYWIVGEPQTKYFVEIVDGDQYETFAAALSNATDGATIKFLADFTGPFRDTAYENNNPAVVSQYVDGVTIDLNGKTWTMTGGAMERCWEDRKGNSFFFENGSLKVVPGSANQSIAFYTYAEMLSFDDVALDFSELKVEETADPADPRKSVPIVSQNGNVKFTGSTTVKLATNQRLVTMLDRASAEYVPGTLTLDVGGTLAGDILLYSACTIAVGEGTTLSGKVYTGAAAQSGFEPAGALDSPFVALVGKIVPKTDSTSTNTRGGQLFTTLEAANAAIETATDKNIIVLNDVEVESFAVAAGTETLEIAANVAFEATTLNLNLAQIKLNEGSSLTAPDLTEADFVTPAEGWKLNNADDTWTIVAIKYATVEIATVANCTIAVTNGDVAVESGAKFDIDEAVKLDVYRVPAAGYKLADGCLAHEEITLDTEKTYEISAAVEEAPAEDDPTNINPEKIPEGKTVGELFKKVPAELATADAKAFATWCQGNAIAGGSNVGEGGAAAKLDAFLLDCGNSAEEIAEAQKNFKVTGIAQDAEGKWVITPATGDTYGNGEITVKSYEDVGCTKEDEDGSFFKLSLGLPK